MSAIVVDTNVLLIAEGKANHVPPACEVECLERLQAVQRAEQVVLDDNWRILGEYHNKLSPNESQKPGSAFLKWLLQVQGDDRHVAIVKLTKVSATEDRFAEFPEDANLHDRFDPADRKFVAAANAHREKPPILQGADTKWLRWEADLNSHGIRIEFLCRQELERISSNR